MGPVGPTGCPRKENGSSRLKSRTGLILWLRHPDIRGPPALFPVKHAQGLDGRRTRRGRLIPLPCRASKLAGHEPRPGEELGHVRISELAKRLLGVAETVSRWSGALAGLDRGRRRKVAHYAREIADTLARAAEAFLALEAAPNDRAAARRAIRELGRISGYVETIVGVLRHHLDGRKLAGLKRRLDEVDLGEPPHPPCACGAKGIVHRLTAAEGYFRALADSLDV